MVRKNKLCFVCVCTKYLGNAEDAIQILLGQTTTLQLACLEDSQNVAMCHLALGNLFWKEGTPSLNYFDYSAELQQDVGQDIYSIQLRRGTSFWSATAQLACWTLQRLEGPDRNAQVERRRDRDTSQFLPRTPSPSGCCQIFSTFTLGKEEKLVLLFQ